MNQHVVSSQVVGERAGTGHAYFVDAGWSRGAAPVASGHT